MQPRFYRGDMNHDRFFFFRTASQESDLYIGVPHGSFRDGMIRTAANEILRLRKVVTDYAAGSPLFLRSLEPVPGGGHVPEEIEDMLRCSKRSGTGPMSAVAGLFAGRVGLRLIREYNLNEIVVENGGDLFIRNVSDLTSLIHAGSSVLSDRVALVLTPGTWGVCTSSGTVGHSLSFGCADAVTVITENAPLADAWATSLANRVTGAGEIERVLDIAGAIPEILGCAIVVEDQIGIRGQFEVKILS
ncbi:MAG TPA: UPF0280 family protein [Bacteroides sp.]|nr:UPF0280 family protein [Bacteroides sp.]